MVTPASSKSHRCETQAEGTADSSDNCAGLETAPSASTGRVAIADAGQTPAAVWRNFSSCFVVRERQAT